MQRGNLTHGWLHVVGDKPDATSAGVWISSGKVGLSTWVLGLEGLLVTLQEDISGQAEIVGPGATAVLF